MLLNCKNKGFTLFELLLIISIIGVLAVIYASSKPLVQDERGAALTVSRTSALMDVLHAELRANGANTWDAKNGVYCDFPAYLPNSAKRNGFNEEIIVKEEFCNDRLLNIYQYVPRIWGGYLENHLEHTSVLSQADINNDPVLSNEFGNSASRYAQGYVIVKTQLDLYGNLTGGVGFIRRPLEYNGSRSSVTSGTTRAAIPKPVCSGNVTPSIHYSVKGRYSYFPYKDDPEGVENLILNPLFDGSPGRPDYNDFYVTSEFYSNRQNHVNGDSDYWGIIANSVEHWVERDPDNDQYDSDGNIMQYAFKEMTGSAPVQDVADNGGNQNNSIWNTCGIFCWSCCWSGNGNNNNPPPVLYVDAWVACY